MDTISNMLVQIKNAQMVKKDHVLVPFSKVKFEISKILKNEGFIHDLEKRKKKSKKSEHDFICIVLKYDGDQSVFDDFRRISKPSRRMYVNAKGIKPVRSGYGVGVISTSKGIMSSKEARKQNVGGEILFEIW